MDAPGGYIRADRDLVVATVVAPGRGEFGQGTIGPRREGNLRIGALSDEWWVESNLQFV